MIFTKPEVLLMTTLEAETGGSFEFKANLGYMMIAYCKQKKTTPHTRELFLDGSGHRGHSNWTVYLQKQECGCTGTNKLDCGCMRMETQKKNLGVLLCSVRPWRMYRASVEGADMVKGRISYGEGDINKDVGISSLCPV